MIIATWTIDFVVLVLTFWAALYLFVTRKFNYWRLKKVPYIPPVAFFGNAFEVFTLRMNIGELTRKIYESTTKPFIGFFICDEPYLLVRDPELAKAILVKDFAVFSDRNVTNNEKDDPMGSNLLFLLKNPDWRNLRRKISPVFSTAKMRAMYTLIRESGLELVDYLKEQTGKNSAVEVREIMAKYTTESITSTAFGIKANCFKNEDAEFRKVSRRIFNFANLERAVSTSCYFIAPRFVKWFKLRFVDAESANFLRAAFWKTMIEREERKQVRNDLLDILIEIKHQEDIDDPYKLDGEKLVAQATQFFIGGYETTSSTLSFALYELAVNKDIQKKLREEIQQMTKKHGEISYDTLKDMDYLDMCVKETIRKYPILPFLDRRCNSNYQLPGTDLVLEKGSSVFISVLGLHYDPKYYPNPEKFDPTRFTEQNVQSRPPFSYLGFGEGPRNCIGARFGTASVKSSLALILSTFEIDLCEQTQHPLEINHKAFLMSPNSELFLRFKRCEN